LPDPHPIQKQIIESRAKRKVIRAGRRGGKTVCAAIVAVLAFLAGHRVLYAAPTSEQIDRFWTTVTRALYEPCRRKIFIKNETDHTIELPRSEQRIKAKTAWNADTLRGDYADYLILDEFQMMNEEAWERVGAPMMLDNNGTAIFIYTPPSLRTRSNSRAKDPQHAAKMFKKALQDDTGYWGAFHFSSHQNPHISKEALRDIVNDMTAVAYRMEINAEDIDEAPGALWSRKILEDHRVIKAPDLVRIVVAIDPSISSTGNEAGIIGAGIDTRKDGYVIADKSMQGSPLAWAKEAVILFHALKADRIVAEKNQGGEMVELTIRQVDKSIPITLVQATRGKYVRAEPIAAVYEQGRIHHVGSYPLLEDELCLWLPGDNSPNRLDALVWAFTDLKMANNNLGFLEYMAEQAKQKEAEA
jgi:hypothetical protein